MLHNLVGREKGLGDTDEELKPSLSPFAPIKLNYSAF
jgi:hypothetical protein